MAYDDLISQLQAQGLLPQPEDANDVGQLNQTQVNDIPAPNIPVTEPVSPGTNLGLTAIPPTVASPGPTPLTTPEGALAVPSSSNSSNSLNPEQSVGQSGGSLSGRTGSVPNPNKTAGGPLAHNLSSTSADTSLKFGDVGGANNAENNALQAEGISAKQQAIDQFNATKARQDAVTLAQAKYVDQLNAADVQYQKERALAHASAAAETAAWMKDLDQKAAEEPQPNRWWHNTSNFGKALWLLGLAFGAKAAASAPGVKNIALEMMQQTMNDDISMQKDRLKAQREAIKEKGGVLTELHKQTLEDQRDDYAHQITRINALLSANTVKANSTNDADLKAQLAGVDNALNTKKVELAAKRADQATQERLKTVEEQHADRRLAITENFGMAKQKQEQGWKTAEEEKDRQLKRDLAEESASAKLAAAEAKAQRKGENFEFAGAAGQSGVNVESVDKNGKPVTYNLSVPKERAKDAQDIIQNAQAKIVALSTLRNEIKKNGIPYGTFSNDVSGVQALKAVADPMLKQLGRASFNKPTVNEVQEYVMGEDPTSLINRMKGGSREDIVKLLDREIQEQTGASRQRLNAIPGINIADDPSAKIVFTAPDTRGPGSHEQTPDEKIEAATGKAPPSVILNTLKDVKLFGDEARDALPSDLRTIVDNAQTSLEEGHTKENVLSIREKAGKAIEAWKTNHTAGTVSANNASKLLDSYKNEANEIADKLPTIINELSRPGGMTKDDVTKDQVISRLTRAGLTSISNKEIQDIVNQINEFRSKTSTILQK